MHKKLLIALSIVLILTSAFIVFFPKSVFSRLDVTDSVVKIFVVSSEPSYDDPWLMEPAASSGGSGCVIKGNRILTNAHVVSDQTFIQVRLQGQPQKYNAKVLAISHEADLALLTVY